MPCFYLQIRRNHLTLKCLDSQKIATGTAAFSTERMLVGQFFIASACLYPLAHQVFPGFINQLRRRHLRSHILIHAQEVLEGGISQIEQRSLQELAVQSFPKGHHAVYADPRQLSDEEVRRIILMGQDKVITAADLRSR